MENSFPPLPAVGRHAYIESLKGPSRSNSFKLDEGYSDETRSQPEIDAARNDTTAGECTENEASLPLPEWVTGLSETVRAGKFLNDSRTVVPCYVQQSSVVLT